MTARIDRRFAREQDGLGCALEEHQLVAVADPRRSIRALAGEELAGSFQDVERLLDQLGTHPIIELGKPLPRAKFRSRRRIGSCHASHNRALLGDEENAA